MAMTARRRPRELGLRRAGYSVRLTRRHASSVVQEEGLGVLRQPWKWAEQ
jgi:hypothetical protein